MTNQTDLAHTAGALAKAARRATEETIRRDELIRKMHDEHGMSLRTIGDIAKLSHTAIAKILAR